VFPELFPVSVSNVDNKKKILGLLIGKLIKIELEKSGLSAKKALTATQAFVRENLDGEIRLLQRQKHL